MPDNSAILDRLKELEVGHEYMREKLDEQATTLKEVNVTVDDIRSRIDRQNGQIPHMQADLTSFIQKFETFTASYSTAQIIETAHSTESRTKIKIIWAGVAVVCTALAGLIMKLVLGI